MTQILDGKALARDLNQALVPRIQALDPAPGLAVIRVGEDPASVIYVTLKGKVATRLGLVHREIVLPDTATESELLAHVAALNPMRPSTASWCRSRCRSRSTASACSTASPRTRT